MPAQSRHGAPLRAKWEGLMVLIEAPPTQECLELSARCEEHERRSRPQSNRYFKKNTSILWKGFCREPSILGDFFTLIPRTHLGFLERCINIGPINVRKHMLWF